MDDAVRIAVVGAGMIGRRHIGHVVAEDCSQLAAIVDPAPDAAALAEATGARWFPHIAAMLEALRPEGMVIATPNRLHVAQGLEAVAAGIPALVEKPIADEVGGATRLVEAAERAGVPLLVGHHRRHNPLVRAAKVAIDAGRIGRVVAVHGMCWFAKPAAYFTPAWRREPGAGPILINLIHDVDLLRHLCGEVASVQAIQSNALRGYAVEDTAAILLQFASGALGTMTVSDAVAAPWSWEFTSGENPDYSRTGETCITIGGTHGALAIPQLDLWRHRGEPNWWEPMERERLPVQALDPWALQVRNLCDVIRGRAAPVVSGRDGLDTLRVIAAIKQAAASGERVELG